MTIEEKLAEIREHVAYLHARIPRSKWTRDDQRIVHLTAKIEAVLALCRDMHAAYESDPLGDAIAYELERAIEEAGK